MRECITPEEMCCVALRYFASGESFRSLEYQFQISRKAISYIVEQVPAAIIKILGETYLKKPNTADESVKILRKFKERWNFPNGLGGVDGKHTVLQQPKSSVSHQSRLKNGLEKNTLNLPDLTPLPDRNYRLPYACTRDDVFPLTAYMMKPYPQKKLSLEKRIFNYRLSRMRLMSENTFGILANRWRVFRKPLLLEPEKVEAITLAELTLHSWLRKESDIGKIYFSLILVDREYPETGEIIEGSWRKEIPSHYLTQELIILLTEQNVSGKNLHIILQIRVVFPRNGNAQELMYL